MRYSEEQVRRALELYLETRSVTKTRRQLGLKVSRAGFYKWIKKAGLPVREVKKPDLETKLNAAHRCFSLGEKVQSVSKEVGFSRSSLYKWKRKHLEGYKQVKAEKKKASRSGERALTDAEKDKEIAMLKARLKEMQSQLEETQFELDVSNATLEVMLKKHEGADKTLSKARTRAAIVDALRKKYPLPRLRERFGIAKSSYYYHASGAGESPKKKKDEESGVLIKAIFNDSNEIYGYRRIKAALERMGYVISEKVIRRLMKTLGLKVKGKKARKYSSYGGEITAAPENLVHRNFHAEKPNMLWLTDITEFHIPAGKAYLSLLMDCFDGMPVAWTIGTSPNAELANGMLKNAIATLHEGEHPILHSDRGCHYRWPEWIRLEEQAGIVRSMSKKGCSPDNAACEGFFGRMKQEMFYGRDWSAARLDEFMKAVDGYLTWFCNGRIKTALGNMTPLEYRQSLGFAV